MNLNCHDRALMGPTFCSGSRPAHTALTLQRAPLRHARQPIIHPAKCLEQHDGGKPARGLRCRVAATAAPPAPAAAATSTKPSVTSSWPCKGGELVSLPPSLASPARMPTGCTWGP